jgi:hypothetical protein
MNFTWNVVDMDRLTSDGFVVTVHYTVNAVDGDYTASTYGTVGYTQEEGNIIPFDSLTAEIVIGWVKDSLGQETVEEALAVQIEAKQNPVQLSGLPWVAAE